MTGFENNYNLEERTTVFSENLLDFFKKCPKTIISLPLIDQGIRSGTSIGANYMEANKFTLIFSKIAFSTKN